MGKHGKGTGNHMEIMLKANMSHDVMSTAAIRLKMNCPLMFTGCHR